MTNLEIYDSTLRDGIQAVGASISYRRRLKLFCELDEFGVHYVELGWPTKDKEEEFIKTFKECEKKRLKTKIVAFGSTSLTSNPLNDPNYETILKTQTKYVCLFGKSWTPHIAEQLRITPEENLDRISYSISFFKDRGLKVFYDAEHYFDGFKDDSSYALETLIRASEAGAQRLILCDTNGGTSHRKLDACQNLGIREIVESTRNSLDNFDIQTPLGIHLHNDRGQALDATFESLPFILQVQGTMNGRGERIGNLDLTAFIARHLLDYGPISGIDNSSLKKISDLSHHLTGLPLPDPDNRLFVGDTAFAHKGGVHIDAMIKNASYEHADPKSFGNRRHFVLNTLGGGSAVIKNAEEFGYILDKKNPEVKEKANALYAELQKLEKEGYRIGTLEAEKFLLIEKYFGDLQEFFKINGWNVKTGEEDGKKFSIANITFQIGREVVNGNVNLWGEHGPVDALYKVFSGTLAPFYPSVRQLELIGFDSKIAHQHGEESSIRTLVRLKNNSQYETVGVDKNIIASAIKAIEKGFSYHLQREYKNQ